MNIDLSMSWQLWAAALAIGAITLLTRASFIALAGRLSIPQPVQRALEFTPVAALTAIVALEVFPSGGVSTSAGALFTPRVVAAAVAALVAWRTRNIILTIVVGMALLWALTFAFGALGW